MSNKNETLHLFRASYLVSNHLAGGVSFKMELVIDSKTKKVVGIGHITQAISPPMNIVTQLVGDYSYMCTMDSCNILVVAEGVSPFHPLIHDVPQSYKNSTLRMVLNEDWKSGTATYMYLYEGEWRDSGYQKVTLIENESPNLEKLTASLKKEEQPVH